MDWEEYMAQITKKSDKYIYKKYLILLKIYMSQS